jgi:EmrB/QacA subfamily drug resistance transporter
MIILKSKSKPNPIMLVLFLGVLMGALDIAIVGPALTPIREAFGIDARYITWIFSIYVLTNLIATPVLAKLSDVLGRKPIYIASVALFAAGSAVVALSPNFTIVLVGRAIQGFGAGGIFPVASAVIGDTYPPEKRGRALGLIGAVFGIAFIIGPLLGGVLLLAGWHWIFIVNLPISVLLVVLAAKFLPRTVRKKAGRFDWAGTVFVAAALGLFVFGLNSIDTGDFWASLASLNVWPFLAGAAVSLIGLILVERRTRNPIIPPVLFARKQLNITHLLSFGAGLSQVVFVFLPPLALAAFNVSSSESSFMLLPSVAGTVLGSPLSGRIIDKRGTKPVILGGIAIMTAGLVLLFFFMQNMVLFFIASFLIGLGLSGILGAPLRYILLNETAVENRSSAQGLLTIFSSSGQLIGAALGGALIASAQVPLSGYGLVFLVIAVLALVCFTAALFLKNIRAGANTGNVKADDPAVSSAE